MSTSISLVQAADFDHFSFPQGRGRFREAMHEQKQE
jgi:hypothetical protein